MDRDLYANLGWLPRAPEDFRAKCRTLLDDPAGLGRSLQLLAKHALDADQLFLLGRTIEKARVKGLSFAPLTDFRLGVLSSSTSELLVPAIVSSAARHGISLNCIGANYNQVVQAALDENSDINSAKPDAVLINIDYRALPIRSSLGDSKSASDVVEQAIGQIELVRSAIKRNSNAICILQTLASPPERLFGNLDRVLEGTITRAIEEINRSIVENLRGSQDVLLDVAGLAATVGLANWHSPTQWNVAKLAFSTAFLPLYAEQVSRIVSALRGKSRRCLILDLDNTLWGGVIGDDGLEGLQLGQGDPTGEAFLEVQRLALALRDRGVVLAVCSKNDDAVARSPFRNHSEMLLREDHFAVFQANWTDKAANIREIAQALGLGLDSMVFLDDNPAERALVRGLIPEVAVPELPEDPALYARTLSAAGYFEAIGFSAEDSARANYYQENGRRLSLKGSSGDLATYLASLQMEALFQPFDDVGRARIAQLINKSNQFNLTTRRYTESEVAKIGADPDCFTLQVRLTDVFGDNGMISVVICRRPRGDIWDIDTWLMSCRVLGRRVEELVLSELVHHAGLCGIRKLRGTYRPTGRNQMVERHYANLGFELVAQLADGSSTWELDLSRFETEPLPISVRRLGFAEATASVALAN